MIKIALTQGLEATVDDQDYGLVGELWRVLRSHGKPYAVTGRAEMMHNRIMCPPSGLVVDHIDGDGLNNQRHNLRIVSKSENKTNVGGARVDNRLGVLGITKTREGHYLARIAKDGADYYLGTFPTLEEARAVRLRAEKELHGIQPRRGAEHGHT